MAVEVEVEAADNPGWSWCLPGLRYSLEENQECVRPRANEPSGYLWQYLAWVQKLAVEKHPDQL